MTQGRIGRFILPNFCVLMRDKDENPPGTGYVPHFLPIQGINYLPKM